MATSVEQSTSLIAALHGDDWQSVLRAVDETSRWLRESTPGDPRVDSVIEVLVELAGHQKWEIRRAVANAAAWTNHPALEPALARFAFDDNALVRQAGSRAAVRRRDWQNAGAFGQQHEERINATLDDIESRFGVRGRQAVKRASEQIADTFARELYHEMIRLIAPVASAAERLNARLADSTTSTSELATQATTIGRRVAHMKAVLDAMRAYTATPKLAFAAENVAEVLTEALGLVRECDGETLLPRVVQDNGGSAVVCRVRLVQALTNVLSNAVESYKPNSKLSPIRVAVEPGDGWVAIIVEDFGCGMSDEGLKDAGVLFATNKPGGTGFGLPLAIKIIESEHQGRLKITSEKGRGTIVRITLPTQQPDGVR
jgi:signal transduction histidine kinase